MITDQLEGPASIRLSSQSKLRVLNCVGSSQSDFLTQFEPTQVFPVTVWLVLSEVEGRLSNSAFLNQLMFYYLLCFIFIFYILEFPPDWLIKPVKLFIFYKLCPSWHNLFLLIGSNLEPVLVTGCLITWSPSCLCLYCFSVFNCFSVSPYLLGKNWTFPMMFSVEGVCIVF